VGVAFSFCRGSCLCCKSDDLFKNRYDVDIELS
jgi:hypothetical protein